MKIAFAEPSFPKTGAVVVGVFEGKKLSPSAERLERETGGALTRAIKASRFDGKKDELLAVLAQLQADPLLDLGLRLGEGSGAALAWPLLESACRIFAEQPAPSDVADHHAESR